MITGKHDKICQVGELLMHQGETSPLTDHPAAKKPVFIIKRRYLPLGETEYGLFEGDLGAVALDLYAAGDCPGAVADFDLALKAPGTLDEEIELSDLKGVCFELIPCTNNDPVLLRLDLQYKVRIVCSIDEKASTLADGVVHIAFVGTHHITLGIDRLTGLIDIHMAC